jgi:hypothetical protein
LLNVLAPIGSLPPASLEPGPPALRGIPGRTERTGLAVGGYQVSYGTCFLMAVELTDGGPFGVGFLAYGQTGDQEAHHYDAGVDRYVSKRVRPLLFRYEDVDADPNVEHRHVTSADPDRADGP